MKRNFLNKRGFTILELMIGMIFFAILTSAIGLSYMIGTKLFSQGSTRAYLLADTTGAMNLLVRTVRQAQTIDDVGSDSMTFTADLGDGTKIFQMYLTAEDGIAPPDNYELCWKEDSGPVQILIRDIRNPDTALFSRDGNVLTFDWDMEREDMTIRLRSKVRPRDI